MPNPNEILNPYGNQNSSWSSLEENRLEEMDRWLSPLYLPELFRVVHEKKSNLQKPSLLDIGLGSGVIPEYLAEKSNVNYCGVDISLELLAKRSQDTESKKLVNGDATNLPFGDKAFTATHSRAVIAWLPNQNERKDAISEQLRVTDKVVSISNFDWTSAGGSPEAESLKNSLLWVLRSKGFDSQYGKVQADEIESVIHKKAEVEHIVLDSQPDNAVDIVFGASTNLLELIQEARDSPEVNFQNRAKLTAVASLLKYRMKKFEKAASSDQFYVALPTVTLSTIQI